MMPFSKDSYFQKSFYKLVKFMVSPPAAHTMVNIKSISRCVFACMIC